MIYDNINNDTNITDDNDNNNTNGNDFDSHSIQRSIQFINVIQLQKHFQ